jgi:tRNA pseudouridine55 synthase
VNGILNLNKTSGMTSFDAVARVKSLLHEKKVGHGGTLDPFATGVLPTFLGQATRLMEYMAELPKTYRVVVELGAVTTTYDAEGEVVRRGDASGVNSEKIEMALGAFRGDIMQAPPIFSALKQRGTPVYKLARMGKAPEMETRPVHVYRLELLEFNSPQITLEIECAKGTYIRSLAYDIGETLGCGAYLKGLVRTSYGPFNITDALTLDEVEAPAPANARQELIQPMETILSQWPIVTLSAEQALAVVQGKVQVLNVQGERLQARDKNGRFLAVLYRENETGLWQPHKVFPARDGDA